MHRMQRPPRPASDPHLCDTSHRSWSRLRAATCAKARIGRTARTWRRTPDRCDSCVLTLRLTAARRSRRRTKLVYFNHRPSVALAEAEFASVAVEPVVRRVTSLWPLFLTTCASILQGRQSRSRPAEYPGYCENYPNHDQDYQGDKCRPIV